MITNQINLNLMMIIVRCGEARKIIKVAKLLGVSGATIMLGKGTIQNKLFEILEIADSRKEIIMMLCDAKLSLSILDQLNEKFKFYKPHHGIAFTIPVNQIIGSHSMHDHYVEKGVEKTMYQMITTIVDRGKAEDVIHAAKSAGSKGGTIIHARGSGVHETEKLFNMEISPEKEVVVIIAETELVSQIIEQIRQEMNLDDPGKGIIFTQSIENAYGLYK
jgi:nitrogen regulatory protein PII